MALARPQHRAMSAERDGLPVMVLRAVDDADALHGAVASSMLTPSPRSLARRAEPHYRMTSDRWGDAGGLLPSPLWGGEPHEFAALACFRQRRRHQICRQ
jgi:hypothetical protein